MQTRGRGRQGRAWASPAARACTCRLSSDRPNERRALVTIAAGVAIAEGIRRGDRPRRESQVAERRVLSAERWRAFWPRRERPRRRVNFVVLGFGINRAAGCISLRDVASRATSLELELGRPVDRGLVLAACLAAFVARYRQLTRLEPKPRDRCVARARAADARPAGGVRSSASARVSASLKTSMSTARFWCGRRKADSGRIRRSEWR